MKKSAILIASLVLLNSCEHVFKTDVYDPRLPELSDDYRRVAGALMDDGVWLYQPEFHLTTSPYVEWIKMKIYNNPNAGHFYISLNEGIFFSDNIYGNEKRVDLGFKITHPLDTLTDLLTIPKEMNLDNAGFAGTVNHENLLRWTSPDCVSKEGKLYIHRIEMTDSVGVVMSGTFGFLCDDCPYEKILHGRFTAQFTHSDIIPVSH